MQSKAETPGSKIKSERDQWLQKEIQDTLHIHLDAKEVKVQTTEDIKELESDITVRTRDREPTKVIDGREMPCSLSSNKCRHAKDERDKPDGSEEVSH